MFSSHSHFTPEQAKKRRELLIKLGFFYVCAFIALGLQITALNVPQMLWQQRTIHYKVNQRSGPIELNLMEVTVKAAFCQPKAIDMKVPFSDQAVEVNCHQWARILTPQKFLPQPVMSGHMYNMFWSRKEGCGGHPKSRVHLIDCKRFKSLNTANILTLICGNMGAVIQFTGCCVLIWFFKKTTFTSLVVPLVIGCAGAIIGLFGNIIYMATSQDLKAVFTVNNLYKTASYSDGQSWSAGFFVHLAGSAFSVFLWCVSGTPLMFWGLARHSPKKKRRRPATNLRTQLI
eukprot:Platyproteum_vivax@DN9155_c0_g1_i1.p1